MAFQETLNASIYFFSFFRSPGSDVSHGPGGAGRLLARLRLV